MPTSKLRRCAIYTRKSSEEGLEQDFNSLHAQREACEAFIHSQAGEGWRLIKTHYDDGVLSGATMERPALQRLLSDVRQRSVDPRSRRVNMSPNTTSAELSDSGCWRPRSSSRSPKGARRLSLPRSRC
jgi:hypothetical protein